jgi:hypothetical protein
MKTLDLISPLILASLLCFNKRMRAAVATGRTSVCGLQYRGSCYHPKNGVIIEKKVSE